MTRQYLIRRLVETSGRKEAVQWAADKTVRQIVEALAMLWKFED